MFFHIREHAIAPGACRSKAHCSIFRVDVLSGGFFLCRSVITQDVLDGTPRKRNNYARRGRVWDKHTHGHVDAEEERDRKQQEKRTTLELCVVYVDSSDPTPYLPVTPRLISQVVVDDLLPTGNKGKLLCSASADKTELWVSIIEKAYLKVKCRNSVV